MWVALTRYVIRHADVQLRVLFGAAAILLIWLGALSQMDIDREAAHQPKGGTSTSSRMPAKTVGSSWSPECGVFAGSASGAVKDQPTAYILGNNSLKAAITTAEKAANDGYIRNQRGHIAMAGGLSVLTLIAICFGVRRSGRLNDERIRHFRRHDPLTDLPNRALFHDELTAAAATASREHGIAILCVDLDHFKSINDAFGRPFGDKLLEAVATRIRHLAQKGDLVARTGGDRFAMLVRDVVSKANIDALAERVIKELAEPYDVEGHQLDIGASLGIASAPDHGATADCLLKAADLALQAAKSTGRLTYRRYEPEMQLSLQARRAFEADLKEAVAKGQLELHYQPLYGVSSEAVTGFEALLRWRHPHRGMVLPDDFIPVAEDLGLMAEIGAWALQETCAALAKLPDRLRIAVNISPLQLRSRSLLEQVRSSMTEAGISASRLELEITETSLLHRDQRTQQQLQELRGLGVRIAMDDFGTGYSSMSYLLNMPFDNLKIDRSFVSELGKCPGSAAIIRAIVDLATSLGMSTTAEGIETREQLEHVRRLGCVEAQGFLWNAPLTAAETMALFAEREAAAAMTSSSAAANDVRAA